MGARIEFDSRREANGEIVADTQSGEFQFRGFADEFHVHRERGVAGIVKTTLRAFDNKAARIAAV